MEKGEILISNIKQNIFKLKKIVEFLVREDVDNTKIAYEKYEIFNRK